MYIRRRKFTFVAIILVILFFTLFAELFNHSDRHALLTRRRALLLPDNPISFEDAIDLFLDRNNVIMTSVVSRDYADLAINFYESSIKRYGNQHYLPVCVDLESKSHLGRSGVPCYFLPTQNWRGYIRKHYHNSSLLPEVSLLSNLKTSVLLQILELGIAVLMLDVDLHFVHDPFPYITCQSCDLHIQEGEKGVNTGFMYVRPTAASVDLLQLTQDVFLDKPFLHHSEAFNIALAMQRKAIKMQVLDPKRFVSGDNYFSQSGRMFAGEAPCPECVVIHDGLSGDPQTKIYRLREHLLWNVDAAGYYSNPQGRYLIYGNTNAKLSNEQEIEALKNALAIGIITKRVVILPKFHCHGCVNPECKNKHHCSLNYLIGMANFDRTFKGKYREHSFLAHTKVPLQVKTSLSSLIYIESERANLNGTPRKGRKNHFYPKYPKQGANSDELQTWLRQYDSYAILNFHSLYGAFSKFLDTNYQENFERMIDKGLTLSEVQTVT